MKAALLQQPGIANLSVAEMDEPEPGPGEVKVRLRASSLNYRDLVTVEGGYGSKQKQSGLIPLSDGAGEVAAVGEGVRRYQVGDRVTPIFFPNWQGGEPSAHAQALALGGSAQGCAAEFGCFPEHGLVPTPDGLSDAEAASTVCAGLTAWHAVVEKGGIRPGDWVLTQGTGGVSIFALQFARAMGARVIATTSSDVKAARLKELGADHVLNYLDITDWGKAAKSLTGGAGIDLVVEVGGAGTLTQSLKSIRIGGAIAMIGILAGQSDQVNMGYVLMTNSRIQGITVGSREMHLRMYRAMEAHAIRPVISDNFALADIREALAHQKDGRHFGKIAIDI
ncbi:MAG: NADPH:quinone oxidoreductase [Rhizobiales bacterium NRL2]|jgi:NADPH:quinone reductase-like Zn-dependent oxidoreductase|nr:MAG: NADPH:quinone oxidoreductase [Rhizobiales bacterium NRL2]